MRMLRPLRRAIGLTQAEVARAIGVSQVYVSGLEAGFKGLTAERRRLLASYLAAKTAEIVMQGRRR